MSKNGVLDSVFDGVSSTRELTGSETVSDARLASHTLADSLGEQSFENLTDLVLKLDASLHRESSKLEGADPNSPQTLAASTGSILYLNLEKQTIETAHLGDSIIIIEFLNGETELATLNTNLIHDTRSLRYFSQKAQERGQTLAQYFSDNATKKEREDHFRPLSDLKNNPSDISDEAHLKAWGVDGEGVDIGTGVINGTSVGQGNNAAMLHYLIPSKHDLKKVKSITMLTDGLVPPSLNENNAKDQEEIIRIVRRLSLKGLWKRVLSETKSDPQFEKHPRFKKNDDATGTFLELKRQEELITIDNATFPEGEEGDRQRKLVEIIRAAYKADPAETYERFAEFTSTLKNNPKARNCQLFHFLAGSSVYSDQWTDMPFDLDDNVYEDFVRNELAEIAKPKES